MTRIRTGPHILRSCCPVGPFRKLWPTNTAPIWDVTWQLGCFPNGVVLTNAKYQGIMVLFKASVPILRVRLVRYRMGIDPVILHIDLSACHKERTGLVDHIKSLEIDIAAIHDVDGAGRDEIESQGITQPTISHSPPT